MQWFFVIFFRKIFIFTSAAIGTAIPIPIVGTIVGAVGGAAVGYFIGEVVARDVGEAYDNFEKYKK